MLGSGIVERSKIEKNICKLGTHCTLRKRKERRICANLTSCVVKTEKSDVQGGCRGN